MLVVRADEKDLSRSKIAQQFQIIDRKLQPMFEDALGGGIVERTREEVLDFITMENMEKCRDEMEKYFMNLANADDDFS